MLKQSGYGARRSSINGQSPVPPQRDDGNDETGLALGTPLTVGAMESSTAAGNPQPSFPASWELSSRMACRVEQSLESSS